jgi:hypothetical protein
MYEVVLALHNLVRWFVVIIGLLTAGRTIWGWLVKSKWSEIERKMGVFFTVTVDIQLLFGLLLYFVFSHWGFQALLENGFEYVMAQSEYRFYSIEHAAIMLLGIVFAHMGNSLSKKADESRKKYKRAAILYTVAVMLIIAGTPWSRPLFP